MTDTSPLKSRSQTIAEARAAAAIQKQQTRGTVHEQSATGTAMVRSSETAAAAVAAHMEAMAKARFFVAIQRPRDEEVVRERLLAACAEPEFAEAAVYELERRQKNEESGQWETVIVPGFNVRFAEAVRQAMGNMDVETVVVLDDDDKTIAQVIVTDLETNNTERFPVIARKTVERQKLRDGQVPIATRTNSKGVKVHIVAATEAEVEERMKSAVSKAMRNAILRLLRVDIKEQCWEQVLATNKLLAEQSATVEKMVKAFAGLGVQQKQLEEFLGKPLKDGARWLPLSAEELQQLRVTCKGIKDGNVKWAEVMESRGAGDQDSDEGGADSADAKPKPTEREQLIAKARDKAALSLIEWDEVARQCVRLCGGNPPAAWEKLTTLQATKIMGWLETTTTASKEAQGGAAQ